MDSPDGNRDAPDLPPARLSLIEANGMTEKNAAYRWRPADPADITAPRVKHDAQRTL